MLTGSLHKHTKRSTNIRSTKPQILMQFYQRMTPKPSAHYAEGTHEPQDTLSSEGFARRLPSRNETMEDSPSSCPPERQDTLSSEGFACLGMLGSEDSIYFEILLAPTSHSVEAFDPQGTFSNGELADLLDGIPTSTNHPVRDTLERQGTLSSIDIAYILTTTPSDLDVLCGRGREACAHVGTKRYQEMISQYYHEYQNAECNKEKTDIIKNIISSIRKDGGRFLRKDEKTGIWDDICDEKAHEKVSNALRSKNREKNQPEHQKEKQEVRSEPTPEEDRAFIKSQKQIYSRLIWTENSNALVFQEDEHSSDSPSSETEEGKSV